MIIYIFNGVKNILKKNNNMPYHFGENEYNHLIGRKVGELFIKNIEYIPDDNYMMTDGHAGKPYLLTLCNGSTFQFRQFQEVVNKYGDLLPVCKYEKV